MRLLLVGAVLFFASPGANAECVISGAKPTVALPTMEIGQEFSFVASSDCQNLRFRIDDTSVSKVPTSSGPVGPGPRTYKVVVTEAEWDTALHNDDPTLTWVVTGRSAGVITRMITTNDVVDETNAIDLSRADAKLVGEEGDDHAGFSVSGAGDVDGDGHDDLLIGAPDQGGAFEYIGAAYLVRGPVTGTLDLSLADAKLVGEAPDDNAGWNVSGAGDVDGDGHDDLLVAGEIDVHRGVDTAGAAYLVRGPLSGTVSLSLADAKLIGETGGDYAGFSLSGAGDVDGDGHDDLLVGAPNYDNGRTAYAGAAYFVLGPVTGTHDLSVANAKFVGDVPSGGAGTSVSGAGDVDGDGLDDFLIGAPGRGDAGSAFLVSGPVTGLLDASMATARLFGETDGYFDAGFSVSGAGDVDADGHDDLLVGAPDDAEGGPSAGAGYLVLGPVTGFMALARADAKFVGARWMDYAGTVSDAGDVNADGHDDVLVGAFQSTNDVFVAGSHSFAPRVTGAAYLVLGPASGTLELSHADAVFIGEESWDLAGQSVSGAGDVDADGLDDLLVGAPQNHEPGSGGPGAAYLIYGGGL